MCDCFMSQRAVCVALEICKRGERYELEGRLVFCQLLPVLERGATASRIEVDPENHPLEIDLIFLLLMYVPPLIARSQSLW
jgi:hypothetical protein